MLFIVCTALVNTNLHLKLTVLIIYKKYIIKFLLTINKYIKSCFEFKKALKAEQYIKISRRRKDKKAANYV